ADQVHDGDVGGDALEDAVQGELVIEVTHLTQAPHDVGATEAARIGGKASLERADADAVDVIREGLGDGALDEFNPIAMPESARLGRVAAHADVDAVEHRQGLLNDVEVPLRDGVERTSVE